MKRIDEVEHACCFLDVYIFDSSRGCFLMETFTEKYDDISFFPKKNKIHIHKTNTWIKSGRQWLKNLTHQIESGVFDDKQEKSYLTENSKMKFGKYKNNKLKDVPSFWLNWIGGKLKNENKLDSYRKNLLLYIQENKESLNY